VILRLLFLFFLVGKSYSNELIISRDSILVGQQVQIEILSSIDSYPDSNDLLVQFSSFEIIDFSIVDTIIIDSSKFLKYILNITSWESGTYKFENLGSSKKITVSEIQINQNEIKGIKENLEISFSLVDYWIYILIILLSALIYVLVKKYLKKTDKKLEIVDKDVKLDPIELTINKLEILKKEELWKKGEINLHFTKTSNIIRKFLELKFNFSALEIPTADIILKYKEFNEDDFSIKMLNKILSSCELAKFAKNQPNQSEILIHLENCKDFVINSNNV
tara:strand:- start:1852 stop:2685 length:834 start_codon:yes stop_codon:yes gene_type:complete